MRPANAVMLVVGVWMGVGMAGFPVGADRAGERRGGGAGVLGAVPSFVLWGWLGEGSAHAAGADVEGRKHARKANHLADINKCKLAIPEYSKALRLLKDKDPTLLFNRAECYRRTGDASRAVADYRKFLVQLPAAPNRAQVEGQIAALDKSGGKSAGTAAAPAKPPPPRATAAPARVAPPEPVATAAPPPTPEPTPPARAVAEEQEREAAASESEAPDLDRPRRPLRVRASAPREQTPALIDSASQHPDSAEGGSSHWWAWVLGAVVIAGGVTGTYFALKQGKTDIPASSLGNYKF
jgi:hypothetical protein